jgi:hypothetical protein
MGTIFQANMEQDFLTEVAEEAVIGEDGGGWQADDIRQPERGAAAASGTQQTRNRDSG